MPRAADQVGRKLLQPGRGKPSARHSPVFAAPRDFEAPAADGSLAGDYPADMGYDILFLEANGHCNFIQAFLCNANGQRSVETREFHPG